MKINDTHLLFLYVQAHAEERALVYEQREINKDEEQKALIGVNPNLRAFSFN